MKTIKVKAWRDILENFTGIVEWLNGDKFWFKEGKHHREDDPAIEYSNGTKYWYLEGKRHREDGPAIEWTDGTKHWYINDNWYPQINLGDYLILDYSEGPYNLMWYRLLDKDKIIEYPDMEGLITK